MRAQALIAAGLVGAVGIGVGVVLFNAGSGTKPLATFAPADSVAYAEAPTLRSALDAFRESPAHKDFLASRTHEEIKKGWKELVSLADKDEGPLRKLKELGLPLDENSVLRFGGQGVAVGLTAPADGSPEAYAISRIDLVGLAKDFAVSGEWKNVWEKLSTTLKGENGKTEAYKGYEIVSRPFKKDSKHFVYFSQASDQVIGATGPAAVKAFLDIHAGEGQGLTSHKGWAAVGKLTSDEVKGSDILAFGWVDMGYWRDGKRLRASALAFAKAYPNEKVSKKMAEGIEKMTVGTELDLFASYTKELDGFAFGIACPKGNPYGAKVVSSHTEDEVFKESKPLDAKGLIAPKDTIFYGEMNDLPGLVTGFLESKGWKTISETAAYKWLNEKLQNPEELAELTQAREVKKNLKHDPRFELKNAMNMAEVVMPELLGQRWALSAEYLPGGESTVGALVQARKAGNEAAAIGCLKTISAAQSLFREGDKDSNGTLDYADSLDALGKPQLVDSVLASGTKQGYTFQVRRAEGDSAQFCWMATASPVKPGTTGDRHFAINHTGVIFESKAPVAMELKECTIEGLQPVGMGGRNAGREPSPPPFKGAALITLRPIGRVVASLVFSANAVHSDKSGLTVSEVEGYTVLTKKARRKSDPTVSFALVGPDLVITMDAERMAAVIKAGKAGAEAGKVGEMIGKLPAKPDMAFYYDGTSFMKALGAAGQGAPPELKRFEEMQQGVMATTINVAKDRTGITVHAIQGGHAKSMQSIYDAMYPKGAKINPALMKKMPGNTFASFALSWKPQTLSKEIRKLLGEELEKEVDKAKKEVLGEAIADPETALLPLLGNDLGLAIVTQPALPAKDAPEEVKAMTFALPGALAYASFTGKEFEKNLVDFVTHCLSRVSQMKAKRQAGDVLEAFRAIQSAQELYLMKNPKEGFAQSLSDLAGAELLDWSHAMGRVGQFKLELKVSRKEKTKKWMLIAAPMAGVGTTYVTNQSGEIVKTYARVKADDACELPKEGAVPFDGDLGKAPEGIPTEEAPATLAKAKVAGKDVYRFSLNEKVKRELGPAGKAFSPCMAFVDGMLIVSTSEHAMEQALSGKSSLADADRYKRMMSKLKMAEGSATTYLHLAGLIDQILENSVLIAKEVAPLPSSLKAPERPDFDYSKEMDQKAMDAMQKAQEEYGKLRREHRKKSKEWREKNAEANAKELERIVGSLRVLGGMAAAGAYDEGSIRSESILSLDPEAK